MKQAIRDRRLVVICATAMVMLGLVTLASAKKKDAKTKEITPITRVIDLHCDTVYQGVEKDWDLKKTKGAVDIPRMRKGNYLAQTFALWTPPNGGFKYLEKLEARFDSWMKAYPDDIALATTTDELLKIDGQGKLGALLAVEGLRPLSGDVDKIRVLYGWGVRILGLSWWRSNEFTGSSTDPDKTKRTGLTQKGREAVKLANELGMVIDVSHSSDDAVREVAELSEDPFIASHSCAKGLRDHERNLSDELLKLIASRGSVVGVNFHVGFLSDDPPESVTRKAVVEHILYMVDVMGPDHVAVGSDFDGAHPPVGLKSAAVIQLLAKDLLDRGLTQQDVDKIMYANALRVFAQVTAPDPDQIAWLTGVVF
jgi:membrane dipeptidase